MAPFSTPGEAKAYVVSRILEQAAKHAVLFDDFECRLLAGLATEDEIERYEESGYGEQAEDLWEKVTGLAKIEMREDQLTGDEFLAAIRLSASDPEYIDAILDVEGFASPSLQARIKSGIWHWFGLGLVCVIGGLTLALAAPFLFDATERLGNSHGAKFSLRLLDRYGAAFLVALIVTSLIWSMQRLRKR